MTQENQLPAERTPEEDPLLAFGKDIAMQWKELGPEHLSAAMQSLEPELRRSHRERMAQMQFQHEERQQQRLHRRHMIDLTVGAVISMAMLGAGVYVAADTWWLATLLCGPSLLALAKVFVLRRSDPGDMRHLSRAARTAMNAAGQAQTPQPPVI